MVTRLGSVALDKARHYLRVANVEYADLFELSEGANHQVFEVALNRQPSLILKFSQGEDRALSKKDPLFGGEVSLRRELRIYRALEKKTSLRTPEILATDGEYYVLMEKIAGQLWYEFMASNDNSETCFLNSMASLGKVFAELHHVTFQSFGDFLSEASVGPQRKNYAKRFVDVLNYRLENALDKGALLKQESNDIHSAVLRCLEQYRGQLDAEVAPAVIVLDDMHPANFFVDESGNAEGFFDIEFTQTAHPSLEYYSLCIFLFNYLGGGGFTKAKKAFDDSYREAGGPCGLDAPIFAELTWLSAVSRYVELCCSYHGVVDGLRDDWSPRFKKTVLEWIRTGRVDYLSAGDMQREKSHWLLEQRQRERRNK